MSDPRAVLLKKYAQRMAELKGYADDFALLQKVEELGLPMVMERKHSDTPMCANVDMYSGLVYTMLDIPQDVFTPLFASARIAGWCANRIEEVVTCHRIMRPAYRAVTTHEAYIRAVPHGGRLFLQDQVFVGDLALADDVGGAGQIQVGDAAGRVTFRVHIQRAAGHVYPHMLAGDLAQQRQHRHHGAGAGAAGVGKILHPALVGALIHMVGADDLIKFTLAPLGKSG